MLEYLVIAASAASLLAAFVYIRSMFKGEAKPNRVTWLMWAIAPFIATAAAMSEGVGWAAVPVFMTGFAPFLIFAASFFTRKAYWKLTWFDYFCGALSAVALALWFVTSDANLAISFAIVSDTLAGIPTLTKTWRNPETESPWPFITGVFNSLTSFAVATLWSFSELAFPAYLVVVNVVLVVAVYNKKLPLHHSGK